MKKIFSFLLAAGVTAIGLRAGAQAPDPDTTARHFIIMASITNLQEVNAGQIAAQKGERSDVKAFGRMMVTDHNRAEQQLLALAKARGYSIPAAATDTPPPNLTLAKAPAGDDFDRMYIHAMASGHGNAVSMFQHYALTGKDPAVAEYARQMLPTLKAHLDAVKALDKKYKDLSAK